MLSTATKLQKARAVRNALEGLWLAVSIPTWEQRAQERRELEQAVARIAEGSLTLALRAWSPAHLTSLVYGAWKPGMERTELKQIVAAKLRASITPAMRQRFTTPIVRALAHVALSAEVSTSEILGVPSRIMKAGPTFAGEEDFYTTGMPDLIDASTKALDGALDTTADRVASITVDAANPANPATISQTSQAIRQEIPEMTVSRANMIARTETARSYGLTSLATMSANGIQRKRWVGSDPCDLCQENVDQGWIGVDESFNSDDDAPPGHPNCICDIVADTEGWLPPMEGAPGAEEYPSYESASVAGEARMRLFFSRLGVEQVKNLTTLHPEPYAANELEALQKYRSFSAPLNDKLRLAGLSHAEELYQYGHEYTAEEIDLWTKRLDASFAHAPALEENVTVYRGIGGREAAASPDLTGLKIGEVYDDKGFMSTTLDKATAERFGMRSGRAEDVPGATVLEIRLPVGSRVIPMSGAGTESELLLPRDGQFRVVEITHTPPVESENPYERRNAGIRVTVEPVPFEEHVIALPVVPEVPQIFDVRSAQQAYDDLTVTTETRAGYVPKMQFEGAVARDGFDTAQEWKDAATARVQDLFKDAKVYVRVPADKVEDILEAERLKNQFETGESMGSFSPKYRTGVEEALFGVNRDALPVDRPVYGYVSNDAAGGVGGVRGIHGNIEPSPADQYGTVAFELKPSVYDRVTAVMGDSFNFTDGNIETGIHPNGIGAPVPFNDPDYHVVPWKMKGTGLPDDLDLVKGLWSYTEAQIYGGVELNDIERVVTNYETYEGRQNLFADYERRGIKVEVTGVPEGVKIDTKNPYGEPEPAPGPQKFPEHTTDAERRAFLDKLGPTVRDYPTADEDIAAEVHGAPFTDSELSALRKYRNYSANLNNELRGFGGLGEAQVAELEKQSAAIDAAFLKASALPENVTLYRGTLSPEIMDAKLGTVLDEKAFMSTSLDRDQAERFAPDVLEIRTPAGTRVIPMSGTDSESELLLPRDVKLRVIDIQPLEGRLGRGRLITVEPMTIEPGMAAAAARAEAGLESRAVQLTREELNTFLLDTAMVRLFDVLGDRLHVYDNSEFTHERLVELSTLPEAVLRTATDHVYIGVSKLSGIDAFEETTGADLTARPRGWAEGKTLDDLTGVKMGGSGGSVWLAGGGSGEDEGVALHEYGHAVDAALGYPSRNNAQFIEFHDNMTKLGDMNPYFVQGGTDAGRSEWFAEKFRDTYYDGGMRTPTTDLIKGLVGDASKYANGTKPEDMGFFIKPVVAPPEPYAAPIATRIMGEDAKLVESQTHDGVAYNLYRDGKGQGYITVYDVDSGNMVRVQRWPAAEDAQTAYTTATRAAARDAAGGVPEVLPPSAPEPRKMTDPLELRSFNGEGRDVRVTGMKGGIIGRGEPDEAALAAASVKLFGEELPLQKYADLIGAPDYTNVVVATNKGRIYIGINNEHMTMAREIYRDPGGKLVMHNDTFVLGGNPTPGYGTHVLAHEVDTLQKMGFDRIVTTAAGYDGSSMNGYYTWARLGYDTPNPLVDTTGMRGSGWEYDRATHQLSAAGGGRVFLVPEGDRAYKFPESPTLQDLMHAPGGAAFWKANGETIDLTFDLKPGSASVKWLEEYKEEKGFLPPLERPETAPAPPPDEYRDLHTKRQQEKFFEQYPPVTDIVETPTGGGTSYFDKFTPTQFDTLNGYRESQYQVINDMLRGVVGPEDFAELEAEGMTSKAEVEHDVAEMDAAFKAAPKLKDNITVFRSTSSDTFPDAGPGWTGTDPGFLSTTLSKRFAEDWRPALATSDTLDIIEIRVPAGTPFIPLSGAIGSETGHNVLLNESEVLLNRGTDLKIVSVTDRVEGGRYIVAEVTPAGVLPIPEPVLAPEVAAPAKMIDPLERTVFNGTGRTVVVGETKIGVDDQGLNVWGVDTKTLNKRAETMFGRRPDMQEYADLIGAPDGAHVTINASSLNDGITLQMRDDLGMTASRYLYRETEGADAGKLIMENGYIRLPDNAPKGMGTHIFAHEVETAQALGVDKIVCSAARSEDLNGYYTWARLGYDTRGPMTDPGAIFGHAGTGSYDPETKLFSIRDAVTYRDDGRRIEGKEHVFDVPFATPPTLQDLMHAPGGAAWWKEHGDTIHLEFDLTPGSPSVRWLNEYKQEKGWLPQAAPEPVIVAAPPAEVVSGKALTGRDAWATTTSNNLTAAENKARDIYTGKATADNNGFGFDFANLNASLRGVLKPEDTEAEATPQALAKTTKALDKAMAKNTFDHDVIVYRGSDVFENLMYGDTWQDKGFISTSTDKAIADDFRMTTLGGGTTVEIHVPAGTHYIQMDEGTREIVLPRGSTFRVGEFVGPNAEEGVRVLHLIPEAEVAQVGGMDVLAPEIIPGKMNDALEDKFFSGLKSTIAEVPRADVSLGWVQNGMMQPIGHSGDDAIQDLAALNTRSVEFFGRKLAMPEYADLIGVPDGSKVEVAETHGYITIKAIDPETGMNMTRQIARDQDGTLVMYNNYFRLGEKVQAAGREAPKGLGTHIFAHEVDFARSLGISRIEAEAESGASYNGYYTWPRLGYDTRGPLEQFVAGAYNETTEEVEQYLKYNPHTRMLELANDPYKSVGPFDHNPTLQDVMHFPGGAAWWKANGSTVDVVFDVNKDSASSRWLEEYKVEKGYAPGPVVPPEAPKLDLTGLPPVPPAPVIPVPVPTSDVFTPFGTKTDRVSFFNRFDSPMIDALKPTDDAGAFVPPTPAFGDFTPREVKALQGYQQSEFLAMNGQLRGLDLSEFTDHTLTQTREEIKALDDAFVKATPLPENVTVYRGVANATMLGDFSQGQVLTDPGFLSTSLDKRVAGGFSDQETGKGAVLEIRLPAGTKAIPLSGATSGDAQSELLLNRGSRFRVISKTWFGHGWRVVVELI
jgi:hypothetical protein